VTKLSLHDDFNRNQRPKYRSKEQLKNFKQTKRFLRKDWRCVCVCVCSEQESNRDLQRRANPSLTSLPPGRNLVHSRSLDAQPESAECVCVCYLWPGCLPALLALISCGILTALGMRCVCVCVCVCVIDGEKEVERWS